MTYRRGQGRWGKTQATCTSRDTSSGTRVIRPPSSSRKAISEIPAIQTYLFLMTLSYPVIGCLHVTWLIARLSLVRSEGAGSWRRKGYEVLWIYARKWIRLGEGRYSRVHVPLPNFISHYTHKIQKSYLQPRKVRFSRNLAGNFVYQNWYGAFTFQWIINYVLYRGLGAPGHWPWSQAPLFAQ